MGNRKKQIMSKRKRKEFLKEKVRLMAEANKKRRSNSIAYQNSQKFLDLDATTEPGSKDQNSVLRIDDRKTLQLIDLCEREECLWNATIDDYRLQSKRKEALERIVKELNIKDFNSRYVMMKFKNLRNSYSQELKKIAKSINSGEDPVYRPRVFWFSKIDKFLRPHLRSKKQLGNVLSSSALEKFNTVINQQKDSEGSSKSLQTIKYEDEKSSSSEGEDVVYTPPTKRSNVKSTVSMESILEDSMESCISDHLEVSQPYSLVLNETDPLNNDCKRDVSDVSKNSKLLEDIAKYLSKLTKNNAQTDDCFDSFGKYVAAMLRNMPKRQAFDVQPKIVKLLIESNMFGDEARVSQSSR